MHLTKVTGQNIKGSSFTNRLAPITIMAGSNMSGKSAMLQSIQLGLTGYLPWLDKTNAGVWNGMAGNPDKAGAMSVELTVEDQWAFSLKWTRDEKGSVKREGTVPTTVAMPALLVDPTAFFGLTEAERVKAVFQACPDVTLGLGDAIGAIGSVRAQPATIRDLLVQQITRHAETIFDHSVFTPQQHCESLTQWLVARLKENKPEAKRLEGVLGGIKVPVAIPKDHSEELARVRAERDEVLALQARAEESERQRTALEKMLLSDPESVIKAARAGLEGLDRQLADIKDPEAPKLPSAKEAEGHEVRKARDISDRKLVALRAGLKIKHEQLEAIKDGECPTCHSKGQHLKNLQKALKVMIRDEEKLAKALEMEIEEANDKLADLGDLLNDFEEAKQRHTEDVKALAEKRSTISLAIGNARAHLATIEEQAKRQAEIRLSARELGETISKLPKIKERIATSNQRIAELEQLQRVFREYETAKDQRDQLEGELLATRCAVDVYDGCIKSIIKLVASKVETAFAGVLKTAREFTDGFLNSPMEYREGELGRRVSLEDVKNGRQVEVGSWIPHTAFSGMEQMLAYIGFSVAIASKAPFRVVFLDELGRLNENWKFKVVHRMGELVGKRVIDQFLGCDAEAKDWVDRSLGAGGLVIAVGRDAEGLS